MVGIQEALVSNLHHEEKSPLIIMMGVIIFTVCLSNCLVIIYTLTVPKFKTVINFYLMSLAAADIFIGNICMPLTLLEQMGTINYGVLTCKIISYVQEVCVAAELWTRVAISIQRYNAIVHPLRSRKWKSITLAMKTIAGIWALAMFIFLPILYVATLQQKEDGKDFQCREKWFTANFERWVNFAQMVICFILPFTIIGFACLYTCRKLYKVKSDSGRIVFYLNTRVRSEEATSSLGQQESEAGTSRVPPSSVTSQVEQDTGQIQIIECQTPRDLSNSTSGSMRSTHGRRNVLDEKKIFITLTIIVLEFFVCWLPLHVVNMLYLYDSERESSTNKMLLAAQFAGYLSTCFNPFIYFFINKNFREKLTMQYSNIRLSSTGLAK